MTTLFILITLVYVILIGIFIFGFFRIKEFQNKKQNASNTFTIIVPFRNEALQLPSLLQSLSNLEYPKNKFEIILINDSSEDDFLPIINTFKNQHKTLDLKVIQNKRYSNSPKKDAITTGIKDAKFKWIITTDADCTFERSWIAVFDNYITLKNPVFIAAPVCFKTGKSFLSIFQSIDFTALIGSTIGGFGINKPFMCNGANLCYQKNAFNSVNGFDGNNTIASGDDIFLMEKMLEKFPKRVHYLKSKAALVTTLTEANLKNLFHQRIRWTSKSIAYKSIFTKFIGVIVLLMNISIIFLIIESIFSNSISQTTQTILALKIGIDLISITFTSIFIKNTKQLILYPLVSILHPFFNISIVLSALIKRDYQWKNRKF